MAHFLGYRIFRIWQNGKCLKYFIIHLVLALDDVNIQFYYLPLFIVNVKSTLPNEIKRLSNISQWYAFHSQLLKYYEHKMQSIVHILKTDGTENKNKNKKHDDGKLFPNDERKYCVRINFSRVVHCYV